MRIGLNALQVHQNMTGVGHYIAGLLDGFMQALAPDDRLIVYVSPFNAAHFRRDDPRIEMRPWGPSVPRTVRIAHEWVFFPAQIERDRLDVYHGPNNFLPRRRVCPSVVTIHDLSQWVDPRRYRLSRRLYWDWMTRHTIRLADRIVADSENTRRDLERFLGVAPERTAVVPAAALAAYKPIPGCRFDCPPLRRYGIGGPFALHVGTLEPGKNLAALVEAFARFRRDSGLDYRLALVGGRGWLYDDIFAAARRHHLEDRVIAPGHVPDADLPFFYNACEFFVFPSLNEGFGLPPLEAMACGAPVIASNASSLPEVLGEAPLYVDPRDIDGIAAAMARLARDPALRQERSQAGLRQARKYSWAETARRVREVYREVSQSA
ncbi:MAG: glycosyltransferase family 1 protein [Candidatus Sumerlaeota bacterium]|nr:glycosyltransferase family 1 protein [Candidatus Sumerlaeota bacterium]